MQGCFGEFVVQDPAINAVRRAIRFAKEPDSPQLIHLWLKMEEIRIPRLPEPHWQLHIAETRLLLDTFADVLLPLHWRDTCLDSIYRPLSALSHLVQTGYQCRQLNHLIYEFRVTSHFFNQA